MGFRNARAKASRRRNGGGRRLSDRVRDALTRGWQRWTSPYVTSRDLTDQEIIDL
jgi:hypothetical protein